MPTRRNVNDTLSVSTHGALRLPATGIDVHYAVGKDAPDAPPWPSAENAVYWLTRHGLGYHRLIVEDVVYELAEPSALVWHNGNHNATRLALCFLYPGPMVTRGAPGPDWTWGRWRTKGREGGAWYPPFTPTALETGAREAARMLVAHCAGNDSATALWPHSATSTHNDPGPAFPWASWCARVRAIVAEMWSTNA